MLPLASWHTWAAFAVLLLAVTWLLRRVGERVGPVGRLVQSSLG
jgi:hypothetical protein